MVTLGNKERRRRKEVFLSPFTSFALKEEEKAIQIR